jgi:hypothetical protein
MRTKKGTGFSYDRYVLLYFFLFTAGNAALSYFPLSLSAKLSIFIFCVLGPFFLAVKTMGPIPKNGKPVFLTEFLPPVPVLWLGLLFLGALLFRFYRLESLSVWPLLDEGRNAFFAMELSRQWDWKFFRDISQMPPLSYWLQGLFLKIFSPSLLGLWLFPALISICLPLLGYLAARRFFSRSFSFCYASLPSVFTRSMSDASTTRRSSSCFGSC